MDHIPVLVDLLPDPEQGCFCPRDLSDAQTFHCQGRPNNLLMIIVIVLQSLFTGKSFQTIDIASPDRSIDIALDGLLGVCIL